MISLFLPPAGGKLYEAFLNAAAARTEIRAGGFYMALRAPRPGLDVRAGMW